MVSENRIVNMSQSGSYTSVQWRGDWELFKREMLAAGTLSVLKPALKLSEEVAAQSHEKLEICHEAEMTQLSERLAAIIILALGPTMGPQQSIVVNREAGTPPQYSIGSDLPKRVHRRVFVERCPVNPLTDWCGETIYTASEKLEHGKRRAIFSCDSVTYVCFEHLLRPVELAWRGMHCLLDPGKIGNTALIHRCLEQSGCNVMLDYDDFKKMTV